MTLRTNKTLVRCSVCGLRMSPKYYKDGETRKRVPLCVDCIAYAAHQRRSKIAQVMIGTGRRPKEGAAAMGMNTKTFDTHWITTQDAIRLSSDKWERARNIGCDSLGFLKT